MHKQFVVIGLGRFGISVAITLCKLGHEVLVIDTNENAVQSIMHEVTHAVTADARDEETLKALGVRNFEAAIVAIGHDLEANILITLMLKEMGIPYVVAKAQSLQHGKVLEKIGADKIIYPEKDMGVRLAHNLISTNVMDYMELSPDYSVFEFIASAQFINKTLGELDLRAVYGVSVIGVKRDEQIIVAPGADTLIKDRDILVVIGENKALAKLPG
jgi:trk system potassium uptake protein TrkA